METRQVFFEGRVQGVGFRYSVKQVAAGYDVTGWVRNLIDGRVEGLFRAEPEELDAFMEGIRESAIGRHIRKVESFPAEDPGDLTGFTIRRDPV